MKNFHRLVLASVFMTFITAEADAQATNFGFAPTGVTQTMSVASGSSSAITLANTSGSTVILQNTGTATAYVKCATTAGTTDFPIQAGWGIAFACPAGHVFAAYGAGATTLLVSQGLGSFAVTGGGGSGGGGGGSVTQGTIPWQISGNGTANSNTNPVYVDATSAGQLITSLTTLNTSINSPTVAGTNIIGKVGIDQTTPGTTNGVSITNANPNGQATMANSAPVAISSNQSAVPVTASGSSGTPTMSSVTVGTGSGTLLAASAFTNFLKVCVAATAANGIWVRWDGVAATQAAPAEYMPPGQCDTWVKSTGFLPTGTITAIASASVAVSVNGN